MTVKTIQEAYEYLREHDLTYCTVADNVTKEWRIWIEKDHGKSSYWAFIITFRYDELDVVLGNQLTILQRLIHKHSKNLIKVDRGTDTPASSVEPFFVNI